MSKQQGDQWREYQLSSSSSTSIHSSSSPVSSISFLRLASSFFISATASSISSSSSSPSFCLSCLRSSYSSMYSSQTAHSFSLNEQNASMQMVSTSLLASSWSFSKTSRERANSSTSSRYLPRVVSVSVSYSSRSSVAHWWSCRRRARAGSNSSFHMRQLARCSRTSMQLASAFSPFSIASTHFASASRSSSRSVMHTSAIPAQACAMSRLISGCGAVDLKGLARQSCAAAMPRSQVWMDWTPWQMSASSMKRLQVPVGTSWMLRSRMCWALASCCVALRRLAQQSTSISSCGFFPQASSQKYSASSYSSDQYFSSASRNSSPNASSPNPFTAINNQYYNTHRPCPLLPFYRTALHLPPCTSHLAPLTLLVWFCISLLLVNYCWMASDFKKTHLTALLILALLIAEGVNSAITAADIFGVRWFLGEKFALQEPIPPLANATKCHLMLMFNSQAAWSTHTFRVAISSSTFDCRTTQVVQNVTTDHHGSYNPTASKLGTLFTTYIHKCPVLFPDDHILQQTSVLHYAIQAFQTLPTVEVLFEGELRSPGFDQTPLSIAVLADWGLLTNASLQFSVLTPITQCLVSNIQANQQIRLMLILGDLAYDLEGQSYVNFLTYISNFTSQMAMLMTPGNHESIRHEDIFVLFRESFYSPCWSRFYGYLDLVSLRGHLLLGYSSEHLLTWLSKNMSSSVFHLSLAAEFHNFTNMFNLQFPPETRKLLLERTIIAYSHYPNFCSKNDASDNCTSFRQVQASLTDQLQAMGVDLFLAGHVHMYERTKQLCGGLSQIRGGVNKNGASEFKAEKGCSVFMVEGTAGNNNNVEVVPLALLNYSESYVSNTGFGILTLNSNGSNDLYFQHLSAKNGCAPADTFIINVAEPRPQRSTLVIWLVTSFLTAFFVAVTLLVINIQKKRVPKEKNKVANRTIVELLEDAKTHGQLG